MPIHRVHQADNDETGRNVPRIDLLCDGPCIKVLIGLAKIFSEQVVKRGQAIPNPVHGRALIDTGASTTCIDARLAKDLGLPVIDEVQILSASHAEIKVSVFPIQIEIVGLRKVDVPRAIGANLKPSGLVALLGRDYLQHCTLAYHGITGEVTLSLWDASISLSGDTIKRRSVFISYSHKDSRWLERVRVHLKPLERDYNIEIWDDRDIRSGSKWREEIERASQSAKVALLIISADFLASDFINDDELPPLLDAAKKDGAVIMPLIVSPSMFKTTKNLSQFQAVNDPSRPLINMPTGEQEEVLVKVSTEIETLLKALP